MKMYIVENGKTKIRFWFPIILIWLFLLILAIGLAPLIIIAALVLWPRSSGKKLLLIGPAIFYLLSSIRGLNIQTQNLKDQVYIYFQ